jgi:putative drug exporter of the RND superfamily
MFARLGSFAMRFRWLIIAAWVVVAAVLTLVAPNIDDVAVSDQRSFLPSSAPSLDAHEMVTKYFPDRISPSSAVLVIDTGVGGRVDEGEPADFVADLTAWLSGAGDSQPPAVVDKVVSPTLGDDATRAGLTSEDKQVALLLVRFSTIGTEPATKDAISAIEERLAQAPSGVETYMTGDGPILAAYNTATKESVDSTTWITLILVVVILLLIYRSPVSPLIPLITIALAYLISRGVVAFLGEHAMTISAYTNIFLIVVLFGAGTDYCLFLISRFREEMAGAETPAAAEKVTAVKAAAVRITVRAVGETIASSAGTVIVGVAMMAFAELGLYNTSGPSIAIGVAIALMAGLTFTPALLGVLGHHAFWPRKAHRMKEGGAWHWWAGKVVKRSVVAFLVPVIVLVPLAIYGGGLARDFDLLADLPDDDETRQGFDTLAAHFGAGEMQPLTVVVVDSARYDTPGGLMRAEELGAKLSQLDHVRAVRSFGASLGDKTFLQVAGQLTELAQGVRDGLSELRQAVYVSAVGGSAAQLQAAAAGLKAVGGYLVQLATAYPEVLQDTGYQEAIGALSELSELSKTGGAGAGPDIGAGTDLFRQAFADLESLAQGLESLQGSFATRPDAILLPDLYLERTEGLKNLRDAYVSADGTAARLQVVLDSGPYSPASVSAVEGIRQVLSEGGFEGGVEGNSAVLLDLRDASDRDMTRAIIFVLGGVFVVLLLLLRALVAPVYLILTILLSYGATLGVTRLLFVDILGGAGVTWWVPMFMFVMLVALGMDYNIFLIGRVKEEVAVRGTRDGTRLALGRTGGIITSAGVIMAGTFASMMSGSILGLLQIGFAVAFGVLLDTFVVRTTLVPAIVVLLGRWSWWPRRGPGKAQVKSAEAAVNPDE